MQLKSGVAPELEPRGARNAANSAKNARRKNNTKPRCLRESGLRCHGERKLKLNASQVVCTGCAPYGIRMDRLPETVQESILRGALYD